MTTTELANRVLAMKHLGISEAMVIVIGEFNDSTANLHQAVFEEIENIMYPHGYGEDAVYCEY